MRERERERETKTSSQCAVTRGDGKDLSSPGCVEEGSTVGIWAVVIAQVRGVRVYVEEEIVPGSGTGGAAVS